MAIATCERAETSVSEPERRTPRLWLRRLFGVPRVTPGDQAGWLIPESTTVRNVPVARDGSDSFSSGFARNHPSTGLEINSGRSTPLFTVTGRHRFNRILVPNRTPRGLSNAAGSQFPGSDLKADDAKAFSKYPQRPQITPPMSDFSL